MQTLVAQVGDHIIRFATDSEWIRQFIRDKFRIDIQERPFGEAADMEVEVREGYGIPFVSFDVAAAENSDGSVHFTRADYLIRASSDFRRAIVSVYNDFALKHALMNLYSSFIVSREWGLLVHSSCIVEGGKAYLFAGHSGAGKSTVALMSLPRSILSDEATVVKVGEGRITVHDSPFRSGIDRPWTGAACELAAIQFLRQSQEIKRVMLPKSEAIMELFGKIFYWPHAPRETQKIMKLFQLLLQHTPAYELYFQKNDRFWKEIS